MAEMAKIFDDIIEWLITLMQERHRQGKKWISIPMNPKTASVKLANFYSSLTQSLNDELKKRGNDMSLIGEWTLITAFRKRMNKKPHFLIKRQVKFIDQKELAQSGLGWLSGKADCYCLTDELLPTTTPERMLLEEEFKKLNLFQWITLQVVLEIMNTPLRLTNAKTSEWQIIPSGFSLIAGFARIIAYDIRDKIKDKFGHFKRFFGCDYRDHHLGNTLNLIARTYLVETNSAAKVFSRDELIKITKNLTDRTLNPPKRNDLGRVMSYRLKEDSNFVVNLIADIEAIITKLITPANPDPEIRIFLDRLFSRDKPIKSTALIKHPAPAPVVVPVPKTGKVGEINGGPTKIDKAPPPPPAQPADDLVSFREYYRYFLTEHFRLTDEQDKEEMDISCRKLTEVSGGFLRLINNLQNDLIKIRLQNAKLESVKRFVKSSNPIQEMTDEIVRQKEVIRRLLEENKKLRRKK